MELEPQQHHWVALFLCTESNRPPEWPALAQVAFNRVASPRYPDTLQAVICQPSQFSAFNEAVKVATSGQQLFMMVFRMHVGWQGAVLFAHAVDEAGSYVEAAEGRSRADIDSRITPATLHYWSPGAMKPAGAKPAWAPSLRGAGREYTVRGIPPDRFVFAEGVK